MIMKEGDKLVYPICGDDDISTVDALSKSGIEILSPTIIEFWFPDRQEVGALPDLDTEQPVQEPTLDKQVTVTALDKSAADQASEINVKDGEIPQGYIIE